jgi:diketogulonate reductase-like aldo/keto reductase
MPLLGFGVYKNFTTKESCLEAFKAGYRYVDNRRFSTLPTDLVCRHVDSAQAYRNEAAVGAAVRESGLLRAEFFISKHASPCIVTSVTAYTSFVLRIATKCATKSHGYESTLAGVDDSLARFQFGACTLLSTGSVL